MAKRRSGVLFVVLVAAVLVVLALALATAGQQAAPRVEQLAPIIPETTKIMDSSTAAVLVSAVPDLTRLQFSQPTTFLEDLQPGDIIVSAPIRAAPDGLLRRVLSVSHLGDSVVVETDTATLEEAIQQGTIEASVRLTPADLESALGSPGITLRRAAPLPADGEFRIDFDDVVLYDEDADLATADDQVLGRGSIALEPSVTFQLVIQDFRVKEAVFSAEVRESARIEIFSNAMAGSLEADVELARFSFRPLVVMVGHMPVVLRPVLSLNVGAEGSVTVGLSTGASVEASLSAGLAYERGHWRPIANHSLDFGFTPPTLSAEARLKGLASAGLELLIYGMAGPALHLAGYLEYHGQVLPSACQNFSGGVQAEVRVKVRLLSRLLVDVSMKVLDVRRSLEQIGTCGDQASEAEMAAVPQDGGDTNTLLVIDVSGSMEEVWHGGVKLSSAKSAAQQILNILEQESAAGEARHRVGLAAFSTVAWLEVPLSEDYRALRAAVDRLSAVDMTNIGAALDTAIQALSSADPVERRIILLLSDGKITAGPSPEEVLMGPVQQAYAAGICIYTIGFGDPGELDEPLLQQIARQSACGEYYYATNLASLEQVYIRVRHASVGTVLAEFSGTVTLDETVNLGGFDVQLGREELLVSLHWPGSSLDLLLTDPRGRLVGDEYPGADVRTYTNLVHAVIERPIPGRWQVDVFGRDVPPEGERFQVLVSARAGAASPPTLGGAWIILAILAIAGASLGLYARGVRRSQTSALPRLQPGEARSAYLLAESGPEPGRRWSLTTGEVLVGRSTACAIRIPDRAVSREHARVRFAAGAWFIQDLGSTGGTFVNGQRILATRLRPGDRITIGSTTFLFGE